VAEPIHTWEGLREERHRASQYPPIASDHPPIWEKLADGKQHRLVLGKHVGYRSIASARASLRTWAERYGHDVEFVAGVRSDFLVVIRRPDGVPTPKQQRNQHARDRKREATKREKAVRKMRPEAEFWAMLADGGTHQVFFGEDCRYQEPQDLRRAAHRFADLRGLTASTTMYTWGSMWVRFARKEPQ